MFCLLFLTPCSRTPMAIAGFKVNQSNFGQTSLSSQSWVVTSNQSVQNGRTVQNYLVSWKKECIQHHLRLIVFVLKVLLNPNDGWIMMKCVFGELVMHLRLNTGGFRSINGRLIEYEFPKSSSGISEVPPCIEVDGNKVNLIILLNIP